MAAITWSGRFRNDEATLSRQVARRVHRRASSSLDSALRELGEIDFAEDRELCHLRYRVSRDDGHRNDEDKDEATERI